MRTKRIALYAAAGLVGAGIMIAGIVGIELRSAAHANPKQEMRALNGGKDAIFVYEDTGRPGVFCYNLAGRWDNFSCVHVPPPSK